MTVLIQILFLLAGITAIWTIAAAVGPNWTRILYALRGTKPLTVLNEGGVVADSRRRHRRDMPSNSARRHRHSLWAA